ncbi:MAG: hypothetical protein DRO23_05505 [Thermoprotei archaeon]|nr:MAG: hypothetical protein DRO23_05505 [Thermoprotei archaeon]
MKHMLKIFIPSLLLVLAIVLPFLIDYETEKPPLPFMRLVYSDNNTELVFTMKGAISVNGSKYVIVEKEFDRRSIRYFVEQGTRKIYYLIMDNNEQYLGFSGIYTILWFTEPPKINDTVPLLDHYGMVIKVTESSFKIRDYYGIELSYKKVGNVYVLSQYGELKLKSIVLQKKDLFQNKRLENLFFILPLSILITITSAILLLRVLHLRT